MSERRLIPIFDATSKIWIRPFSVILNCMLPVEWIYGEWAWWQANSAAKRSDQGISCPSSRQIEAGSQVEGFCIPRFMVAATEVNPHLIFLDEKENWEPDFDCMKSVDPVTGDAMMPMFTAEHAAGDPRYVKLRLTQRFKELNWRFKNITFLHHAFLFESGDGPEIPGTTKEIHGPVRKMKTEGIMGTEFDDLQVFKYPEAWPEPAMEWLIRPRPSGWPSAELVQEIFGAGCHLAPVGRRKRAEEPLDGLEYVKNPERIEQAEEREERNEGEAMDEFEWRMSFSVADNLLGQSVNPVARHVMILLKMLKKLYFPEVICTYYLKNLLFWECELKDESFWSEETSAQCLLHMLDRLQECLEKRNLPHYMMPQSNLLQNEDPVKLAEAAASVATTRRNILTKTLSLLKRVHSISYCSNTFLQELDIEKYCLQFTDDSLSSSDQSSLMSSLYKIFAKKCNEVLHLLLTMTDEDIRYQVVIAEIAYTSLLGRILCKLWGLRQECPEGHNDNDDQNNEQFISFINNELDFSLSEDLAALYTNYLDGIKHGKDLLRMFPASEGMQVTKDLQMNKARKNQEEQQLLPMKLLDLLGMDLRAGDIERAAQEMRPRAQENLENISYDDLERMQTEAFIRISEERTGERPRQISLEDLAEVLGVQPAKLDEDLKTLSSRHK